MAYDGGSNVLTVITARALFVLVALWSYLAWSGAKWRLPANERNISLALGVPHRRSAGTSTGPKLSRSIRAEPLPAASDLVMRGWVIHAY